MSYASICHLVNLIVRITVCRYGHANERGLGGAVKERGEEIGSQAPLKVPSHDPGVQTSSSSGRAERDTTLFAGEQDAVAVSSLSLIMRRSLPTYLLTYIYKHGSEARPSVRRVYILHTNQY